MHKIKILVWVLSILLVLVIVGIVLWVSGTFSPSYYAVYMTTGDLYFGKLTPFSHTLTNVWYIQRDTQGQGQSLNLNDFSRIIWGPSNSLELNKESIVWINKLSPTSKLISVFNGGVNVQGSSENSQLLPAANPPIPAPESSVLSTSTATSALPILKE